MAGHSKWANIQHRKGRQDAKRGKIFTRLIKEITIAAKLGGGDPDSNPRLRLAMDKATDANMPKDNIQRAIDKGTGNLEGVEYVELRYEGYGIGGAAVMVDCLTDNKTRTVADVRHAFNKHGGNMGTDGSVAFQFVHQGYLLFGPETDEDTLMEAALEAGAVGECAEILDFWLNECCLEDAPSLSTVQDWEQIFQTRGKKFISLVALCQQWADEEGAA